MTRNRARDHQYTSHEDRPTAWAPGRALLAWALLLLFAAMSCGEPGSARDEPVRIGVIVSLSGSLMSVGPHLANAARLAAREINAAGGVLGGRAIELVIGDDRTDPSQAVIVARRMIDDDGVVAIIGSLSSDATGAVQEVTRAAGIPQISCCSTSAQLSALQPPTDRFLFRTAPSDTLQARVVVQLAVEQSCERLAILSLQGSYGNPFATSIADGFTARGKRVVSSVSFPAGRSSYTNEVTMIASATPDCIALVGFPDEGGAILRDWAALTTAPEVTWIGTDGLKDEGFPEAAGDPAFVEGVIGTAPITAPDTQAFNEYSESYQATFGALPGIFGGAQFDATTLVALAIESARSTDGAAIRDALYRVSARDGEETTFTPGEIRGALEMLQETDDIDYEGASGNVDFDAQGDVITNYEVWEFTEASGFARRDVILASELSR